MKKIFLSSHKGGTGKTFLSINFAAFLGANGKKVLYVDMDPLESSESFVKVNNENTSKFRELIIYNEVSPGLNLVNLSKKPELLNNICKYAEVKKYDYLFFDTSSTLSDESKNLFKNTDSLFIIIQNEPLSYRTLPVFLEDLLSRQKLKKGIFKGILLNMVGKDEDSELAKNSISRSINNYLLNTYIGFEEKYQIALLEEKPLINIIEKESDFYKSISNIASKL